MEENLTTKTCLTKNLGKTLINQTVNLQVDSNANIKTVLDVESFLYDIKVESLSGKANFNARLGVKVLYIDTDNITNTLSDNVAVSEVFDDASILTGAFINAFNYSTVNNVNVADGSLKIACEISVLPVLYLNLPITNSSLGFENLIVKKNEIITQTVSGVIASSFDYSVNFETKEDVSKILMYNCNFACENVRAEQGRAVVEGKIYSTLVFESAGEESEIKELNDVFSLKTAIDLPVDVDDVLDVVVGIDHSRENISTDSDAEGNVVSVGHKIMVQGVSLKNVKVDLVDDLYSVENEVELNRSKREYCTAADCFRLDENVGGEIAIEEDESAVDKIVSNLCITPEITNTYIKDGQIVFEGLISSGIVYLDENREYKQKRAEIPFIVASKIKADKLDCVRTDISVYDCRLKAKRGTIIEVDYQVKICVCIFEKDSKEILDNYLIGKPLDFGGYDYQIFVARSGESVWDLSKRIKVSPEDLVMNNPALPSVMEGGEKVIIKR